MDLYLYVVFDKLYLILLMSVYVFLLYMSIATGPLEGLCVIEGCCGRVSELIVI